MIETHGYLLDTSVLSARYDASHPKHATVKTFLDALPPHDLVFVSAVAIAEIQFGAALYSMAHGRPSAEATTVLSESSAYNIREITKFTGREYGSIKANVAFKYLRDPMDKKQRTPWIEEWIDQHSANALHINEGDLWMCAQEKERNLILLTIDEKMRRITAADPDVQVREIP